MLGEFGQLFLSLALVSSFLQSVGSLYGVRKDKDEYIKLGAWSGLVHIFAMTISFIILTIAFSITDLSIQLVASNSHVLVPMLYKLSGVWGNHEGSLFLWCLMLSFFSLFFLYSKGLDRDLRAYSVGFMGLLSLGLTSLLLVTSNPFSRLVPPAGFGGELNPILQDPALAIHPPMLYVGYVGLSAASLFALSMIVRGSMKQGIYRDSEWKILQGLNMFSWIFLTAGIALGSSWAYNELGWGGFWFWDPVENSSLMPWLIATSLIHAGNISRKKESHRLWIAVLALIAFLLSLLGTFLVRSGLLVSPHTFASDPSRGIFLLMIFSISAAFGVAILVRYGNNISTTIPSYLVSRANVMFTGSMVLVSICGGVLVGTLYPLFAEVVLGQVLSVGHPYYNFLFVPMGFFLLFLAGVAPLMSGEKNSLSFVARRIGFATLFASLVFVIFLMLYGFSQILALLSFSFVAWLLASIVTTIFKQGKNINMGMILAHIGLALLTIGIAGNTQFSTTKSAQMSLGETVSFGSDRILLKNIATNNVANYQETLATIVVEKENGETFTMYPSRRVYQVSEVKTIEPYILNLWWGDYHAILGNEVTGDRTVMRFYKKPLVLWMWIGCGFMVLGGVVGFYRRSVKGQL